jgi:hypothetical protein
MENKNPKIIAVRSFLRKVFAVYIRLLVSYFPRMIAQHAINGGFFVEALHLQGNAE